MGCFEAAKLTGKKVVRQGKKVAHKGLEKGKDKYVAIKLENDRETAALKEECREFKRLVGKYLDKIKGKGKEPVETKGDGEVAQHNAPAPLQTCEQDGVRAPNALLAVVVADNAGPGNITDVAGIPDLARSPLAKDDGENRGQDEGQEDSLEELIEMSFALADSICKGHVPQSVKSMQVAPTPKPRPKKEPTEEVKQRNTHIIRGAVPVPEQSHVANEHPTLSIGPVAAVPASSPAFEDAFNPDLSNVSSTGPVPGPAGEDAYDADLDTDSASLPAVEYASGSDHTSSDVSVSYSASDASEHAARSSAPGAPAPQPAEPAPSKNRARSSTSAVVPVEGGVGDDVPPEAPNAVVAPHPPAQAESNDADLLSQSSSVFAAAPGSPDYMFETGASRTPSSGENALGSSERVTPPDYIPAPPSNWNRQTRTSTPRPQEPQISKRLENIRRAIDRQRRSLKAFEELENNTTSGSMLKWLEDGRHKFFQKLEAKLAANLAQEAALRKPDRSAKKNKRFYKQMKEVREAREDEDDDEEDKASKKSFNKKVKKYKKQGDWPCLKWLSEGDKTTLQTFLLSDADRSPDDPEPLENLFAYFDWRAHDLSDLSPDGRKIMQRIYELKLAQKYLDDEWWGFARKLDKEKVCRLVGDRMGEDCTAIRIGTSFHGSFNHCITLHSKHSGRAAILKISSHAPLDRWTNFHGNRVRSEARLMIMIKEKSPAANTPTVYGFSTKRNNAIQLPFILMSAIEGNSFAGEWVRPKLPEGVNMWDWREDMIRALAAQQVMLYQIRGTGVGAPCWKTDDDDNEQPTVEGVRDPIYDEQGRVVSIHAHKAASNTAEAFNNWRDELLERYGATKDQTVEGMIKFILAFIDEIPAKNCPGTFLRHEDLDVQNAKYDRDGSKVGLYDFEGATFSPSHLGAASFPMFLSRDWFTLGEPYISGLRTGDQLRYWRRFFVEALKEAGLSDEECAPTLQSHVYWGLRQVLTTNVPPFAFAEKLHRNLFPEEPDSQQTFQTVAQCWGKGFRVRHETETRKLIKKFWRTTEWDWHQEYTEGYLAQDVPLVYLMGEPWIRQLQVKHRRSFAQPVVSRRDEEQSSDEEEDSEESSEEEGSSEYEEVLDPEAEAAQLQAMEDWLNQ